MIGRVLDHMSACHASGTLIVPEWPLMHWWPRLFPYGNEAGPVLGVIELPPDSMTVAHPRTILRTGRPSFKLLAVRLSFP